jgi:hypothetical protein
MKAFVRDTSRFDNKRIQVRQVWQNWVSNRVNGQDPNLTEKKPNKLVVSENVDV